MRARKLIGRILWFIQLITTVIFYYELYISGMVVNGYLYAVLAILAVALLFTAIFMFLFIKKKPYFVGMIMALLMSIVCGAGFYYLHGAISTLMNISDSNIKVTGYGVYVDVDDEAENIEDAADYTFGIVAAQDRDNTDQIIDQIEAELDAEINVETYSDMYEVTDAVLSQEIDSMIINAAYIAVLEDTDGYEELASEIKAIAEYKVETSTAAEEIDEEDGIFTVFISGIDVTGDISTTSRSDVNILAVINRNTHQVLLVSTPRDYYVTTSVSYGQKDKLTHAGLYGVDCSMETLSMLYDTDVDYYFRVNFTGFEEIIDALGGIDVYSDIAFTSWTKGLYFSQGINHMNGEYALEFARERHAFASGDNQRGINQMKIIEAVIDTATSTAILNDYSSLMSALSESFETSMPYSLISDMVQDQLDNGGTWDVQKVSVTGTGSKATTYSAPSQYAYVMIPDEESVAAAQAYIDQVYNNEVIDVEADSEEDTDTEE
ncbi:MAG: LCP family protein [Eubacterium sp.]|nr:LCP family protein [Eubacterium sp.]